MNILTLLNVSNLHNIEADSGFIFTRAVAEGVLNVRPGWRFFVVCPPGITFTHPGVIPVNVRYSPTKYQTRFEFDWPGILHTLKRARAAGLSLLWVNQAEQAGNLAALVRNLEGRRVPVFTYFHYPSVIRSDEEGVVFDPSLNDWSLGTLVHLRQYEALVISDRAAVGSDFARDLILSSFKRLSLPVHEGKLVSIPPPLDFRPVSGVSLPPMSDIIVLYNHRLYRHYGTERLIQWIEELRTRSSDSFTLLVTDPLGQRSPTQERLDSSVSEVRNKLRELLNVQLVSPSNRSEYLEAISSAHVGLAPFREAPPWSMASVDIMARGRPLLAPDSGPFPEMLAGRQSLLFGDKEDFFGKLNRLLTSEESRREEAEYCLRQSARFEIKELSERYARLFEATANMPPTSWGR